MIGKRENVLVESLSKRDERKVSGKGTRGITVTLDGTEADIGTIIPVTITSAAVNYPARRKNGKVKNHGKVLNQAELLAEAILESEEYIAMRLAEQAAMKDEKATQLIAAYTEKRQAVENLLADANMDHGALAKRARSWKTWSMPSTKTRSSPACARPTRPLPR